MRKYKHTGHGMSKNCYLDATVKKINAGRHSYVPVQFYKESCRCTVVYSSGCLYLKALNQFKSLKDLDSFVSVKDRRLKTGCPP